MSKTCNYVIIDTDCGSDDAMAIMLATYGQKNGLIDILAITCTHGNTCVQNVCTNVCHTLKASDLETIPIYRGCEGPLIGKHEPSPHYGDDGLGGATKDMPPIKVDIKSEYAPNALVRLAKEHPKQVTLMVLGPITNIAVAYQLDNEFFANLKEVVVMGGTVDYIGNTEPTVEFNIGKDPEACQVLLSNAKCPLTFVPWECGLGNLLTWDIFEKISKFDSKKAKFVQKIMNSSYERTKKKTDRKGLILCDILVVVAVVYNSLIETTQTYKTGVELNGKLTRGQLVLDKRTGFTYDTFDAPDVKYILHFDQQKLMQLILDLLK